MNICVTSGLFTRFKLIGIGSVLLVLGGCGVGGVGEVASTDECKDPVAAKVDECNAKNNTESSTWDKMKWNVDNWG